ncbi:hypothetical protein B0H34DRAFT_719260 [Crassisporium funariophilum]|nr:hypothetical protein B0H34DRAFT_719260 [Crassisporium funariophilum]
MASTVTTSALQGEPPLRKRLRMLERAHSLSSIHTSCSNDANILPLPKMRHENGPEDIPQSSPTDYESRSDSSDEEEHSLLDFDHQSEEHARPSRPTVNTTDLPRRPSHKDHSPMSPATRAWYEFDLAVVVALVSPIGNWLTGGDHVKNLLLIVLLIYYLHQIIEIPWTLYQKSRPRNRPSHLTFVDPQSPEGRYAHLATSELQKLEFLFLFLTFLSPLLGAALLRYATAAILGEDAVSWFSTGLFILATGMRPWAHLIERLNQRTAELQDYIHHPSPTHVASEEQHVLLENRVTQLEKLLSKMSSKVAHAREDVYEYVDDAVDAMEHAMRKQERKWEKFDGKVTEVEKVVIALQGSGKSKEDHLKASLSSDLGSIKASMRSILEYIFPKWLLSPPHRNLYSGLYTPSASSLAGGSTSKYPMQPPLSPGLTATRSMSPLDTIVEEDRTSDDNLPGYMPYLARPYLITSYIVSRIGYLFTLPLRAVARMILRNY